MFYICTPNLVHVSLPPSWEYVWETLDHSRDCFGNYIPSKKFRGGPICQFEVLAIINIHRFSLKMHIHAPFKVFEDLTL